ncbi:ATP12-domain-containing protein [Vararia minispora EC-137]|uniref:ATP12-domain-containing protein n=1 Tax=Vararia minispora EC-137 TaxID=1314806 RepID=A0ACB8QIM4_9AGAM|nr:ATP12-domain-containing protein [Vararia minispora EC-137]
MFLSRLARHPASPACRRTAIRILRPPTLRHYATESPAQPATATNRAEATLKRFWKHVDIVPHESQLAITLDKRPLKTPAGKKLLVPTKKQLVASLIASEWDNQVTVLKPHSLPMTSLTARAIDSMEDERTRAEVREALLKYFDTDTICFFSERPEALAKLEEEHWIPTIDWARQKFGIDILTTNTIVFSPQPDESKKVLDEVMQKFDLWQMAAMERATYTTKSFLLALALVHKRITAEQTALASQVEVSSQIQAWGEVEDSHDVDYHDVRRHVASAACLLSDI